MDDIFSAGWFTLMMPALAAFFGLAAALALLGLVRANKGARINRAWGLIALAAACFGLAGLDATLEELGLPNAASLRPALAATGSLLAAIGAVYARSIHRSLLK
jgi:hypothetical protein